MRIAISILTVGLDRLGGRSQRLVSMLQGLGKRGHEIFVLQTKQALNESRLFFEQVSSLPIRSIEVDFHLHQGSKKWFDFLRLWQEPIDKFLPEKIDILDLWDPMINLRKKRNYKVVFSTNRDLPYFFEHFRYCGIKTSAMLIEAPFLYWTFRNFGKLVDGYITETEAQRRWAISSFKLPEHIVTAIPPGYDSQLLPNRDRLETIGNNPAIVFSGRLHQWKGVFELLEAFVPNSTKYPHSHLCFIGDGLARRELTQRIEEHDLERRVTLLGRQSYSCTLGKMAQSEIFVLPSYIESFPLSLVEAMAMGLSCIATQTGGIQEHLLQHNKNGLLVRRKSVAELTEALDRLLANQELRTSFGVDAQKQASKYTFNRMIEATETFYQRILHTSSIRES